MNVPILFGLLSSTRSIRLSSLECKQVLEAGRGGVFSHPRTRLGTRRPAMALFMICLHPLLSFYPYQARILAYPRFISHYLEDLG